MRYDGREGKGKSREIRMRGGVTRIDRRISTRGKKLEWLLTSDEARTEYGGGKKREIKNVISIPRGGDDQPFPRARAVQKH